MVFNYISNQSIPLILHQIRVDIKFGGGDGENATGRIAIGLEDPGVLPLAKEDQIISSSPAFSGKPQSVSPQTAYVNAVNM